MPSRFVLQGPVMEVCMLIGRMPPLPTVAFWLVVFPEPNGSGRAELQLAVLKICAERSANVVLVVVIGDPSASKGAGERGCTMKMTTTPTPTKMSAHVMVMHVLPYCLSAFWILLEVEKSSGVLILFLTSEMAPNCMMSTVGPEPVRSQRRTAMMQQHRQQRTTPPPMPNPTNVPIVKHSTTEAGGEGGVHDWM